MTKHESQPPASGAAPRQHMATLLERMGWGMLGVAVIVWCASSMLLVYGISLSTGWSLLAVFIALITVSLALIGTAGPIAKSLFRKRLASEEPDPSPTDLSWVEHWEELMRQPVR